MNTPQTSHQAEVIKRLARVEGQIRGIQKLIVAESDCEKILQQMTAARRALDKAFFICWPVSLKLMSLKKQKQNLLRNGWPKSKHCSRVMRNKQKPRA